MRNIRGGSAGRLSGEVDATAVIDAMERRLDAGHDLTECRADLAILRRWQHDRDLTRQSRDRAAEAVKKFRNRYA